MVLKDQNDNWKCIEITGWLGEINAITTHTSRENNGKLIEETLKQQFNYDSKQIKKKKKKFMKIGTLLASELEKQVGRPYVDFGIDFGLDKNGKIWIFEANVYQNLKFPLWINDHKMYQKIINYIIKYLKKVAMS